VSRHNRLTAAVIALLALCLLIGCAPTAPVATATPVPPAETPAATPPPASVQPPAATATPVPPTATPVLPAATLPPPTATRPALPTLSGAGGGVIAFTSERKYNQDIFLMNADGSEQTPLTTGFANESAPSWSPDGTRIAYSSGMGSGRDIYVMNADGTGIRQLTDARGMDYYPVWRPSASTATAVAR
jgi:dipeptidyl aminopeptidase/acylaminoacyl peptidase